MGLTSALNTSLNGLILNETSIDVLGNNIANAGTNGFKSSTAQFATQLSRTYSVGSRANLANGGTNPRQAGLGAKTSAIVKDFTQGNVTNSTSPSDLAIEGDGFFIVKGSGGQAFTRAGNFLRNSESYLVNQQGDRVQGYAVDEQFNLVTTGFSDLRIPLGELNVTQQTHEIKISGALSPTGVVGTQGASTTSQPLVDSAAPSPSAASLLTNLKNSDGTALFPLDKVVSFAPHKGGQISEPVTLTITAQTNLGDLLSFLQDGSGIQTGVVPLPSPAPGVTLEGDTIQVIGNQGSVNNLSILPGDLSIEGVVIPLTFTQNQTANGESAVTNFVIYDSLGSPIDIKLATVLESVTATTTTFRWYVDSADDSRRGLAVGTGTVTFDGEGKVIGGGIGTFSVERNATAARSPMSVNLDLSAVAGISAAATGSRISLANQDGSGPGTLVNFVIDDSGTINGVFDNGVIRTLGQVVLARFANPQGLIEAGDTKFTEGVSSGSPFYTTPGDFGAGSIRAGAVELSNTDIGRNLVDLIVASTNYRGNARVISSVQQLVDELFVLGR